MKCEENNGHSTCRQTFLIISRSILLKMRNVSDTRSRENLNTHSTSNTFFFFFDYRAVYEIMWKNKAEPDKSQMPVWRMRIALWIPKATNTHTHTHTLRIRNIYCFSTATGVARTRLNVTSYVHCPSWS